MQPVGNVTSVTSRFWSGYAYCPIGWTAGMEFGCNGPSNLSRVLGADGAFNVPALLNTSVTPQSVAVWVGVGGLTVLPSGSGDLVQAGIQAWPTNASTPTAIYRAWWEMLGNDQVYVNLTPNPQISPHDSMWVSVTYTGTNGTGRQFWTFLVVDNTTRSTWSGTEAYVELCVESGFESADWVVESPPPNILIVPLLIPAFSAIEFSGAAYLGPSGSWHPLKGSNGTTFAFSHNATTGVDATPSKIYAPAEFWVQFVVDTTDAWATGDWGGVSIRATSGGDLLFGNLTIGWGTGTSFPAPGGLGLAFAISNASMPYCQAVSEPFRPLSLLAGTHLYTLEAPVCGGLAPGLYLVSETLWYQRSGSAPASNASLLLFDTGPTGAARLWVNVTHPARGAGFPAPWLVGGALVGAATATTLTVLFLRRRPRGPSAPAKVLGAT